MDFKQYLTLISRNLVFICILAIIGVFLGLYSVRFLPSGYRQSQIFFISQSNENGNIDATAGQEKVINYTDSAVSIIQSEDFQLSSQISQSKIEAKKLAPQVVQITSTGPSAEKSMEDLSIIKLKFNEKTEQLLNDKSIQLVPIGTAPQPVYSTLDSKTTALFGAIIGIITAYAILALVNYFKL